MQLNRADPMYTEHLIQGFVDVRLASRTLIHKRLKNSYNVENLFERIPTPEKAGFYLTCLRFNAEKIAKVFACCLTGGMVTGGVIGAIVGSVTVNPFGAAACSGMGIGTGAGVGAIIGTSICISERYWYEERFLDFFVKNSARYDAFMLEISLEHYAVFLEFLKYYIKYIPQEAIDQLDEFICSITYTIPKEPVFSPHDGLRSHVYEKSSIEQHLDKVESRIQAAIAEGKTAVEIKALQDTADPFRGPYFQKHQLVFDLGHVGKTIKFLRGVQKNIPGCDDISRDPLLPRMLSLLIDHYHRIHKAGYNGTVNILMKDMLSLGVEPATVLSIGQKFQEEFKKKKEQIAEQHLDENDEEMKILLSQIRDELRASRFAERKR